MKFASKLAAFSVLVMFFTVSAATAAPSQVQAFPAPQGPGAAPARSTVVEKFLGQYAKEHPFAAGVAGQSAPPSQAVNAVPGVPNVRPRTGPQSRACSIPLLQKKIDRSKTYAIQQITPPAIDEAMVIKPAAPACDEPGVNRKP